MIQDLANRIVQGDRRALARAATLVDNGTTQGVELLKLLFGSTGRSIVVGITGPPGVGKSTLVDALIIEWRGAGRTVAVLAIDPSSSYTNGAILGDRIRMGRHYQDEGVFVRSAATRGQLGGITKSTFDLTLLLDAAGWDIIIIETVGVGQDEIDVARLADITLVVLVPGLGDDVQAIKAGIMETADLFVINKADLPGANRLEGEIRTLQSLSDDKAMSAAPVRRVVANQGTGVAELSELIIETAHKSSGHAHAEHIWVRRLREMLLQRMAHRIGDDKVQEYAAAIVARKVDPFSAVEALALELGIS